MQNTQEIKDEIIEGLRKNYGDQLLKLSDSENERLHNRIQEYKDLLRKSVLITYMLMNISTSNI